MNDIISTEELQKKEFEIVEKYFSITELWGIHFKKATSSVPEGTYIYSEDESYYIVTAEKGNTKEYIKTDCIEDVTYFILHWIAFNKACDFAVKNTKEGTDFRRALFSKELELLLQCNRDVYNRRKKEIEEILLRSPYRDCMN